MQTYIAQTLRMQLGGVVVGLGLILGHMTKYIYIHARHMYCYELFAQVLMLCMKSCMYDGPRDHVQNIGPYCYLHL